MPRLLIYDPIIASTGEVRWQLCAPITPFEAAGDLPESGRSFTLACATASRPICGHSRRYIAIPIPPFADLVDFAGTCRVAGGLDQFPRMIDAMYSKVKERLARGLSAIPFLGERSYKPTKVSD